MRSGRLGITNWIILLLAGITFFNLACKKSTPILGAGGNLLFSTDTLTFDTVFTAAGSFTTYMKIFNPQSEEIQISSIRLLHGSSSYFHLNIDGAPGNTASNVKIAAHDSIYVFATVNIDPRNQNTPYVVTDSIVATLNGKDFYLPFEAYGQDANYIVGDTLDTQTWTKDRPWVIVHSAEVMPGQTLTINPGTHVYMHADSRLIITGTLIAQGNLSDSIVFLGDRLDRAYFGYQGYPGEWGGLYFTPYSSGSILDYVKLENGGNTALNALPAVIQTTLDSVNDPNHPQLTMMHTIIENSIGYGIVNFGGTVVASNCLVNTCGAWCFANIQGGNNSIVNCTFVCYGTDKVDHTQTGAVALLNYLQIDDTHYTPGKLSSVFTNCIIYGSQENELYCNQQSGASAGVTFNNCLVKADSFASFVLHPNCIINQDPLFTDYKNWNYRLKSGSPAIDAGTTVSLQDDLDGKPRPHNGKYDMGCYEYQN